MEEEVVKSLKYMIAIDSESNVCFNSTLYPYETPNHTIFTESGILDKFDSATDIIRIDKSYEVGDLLRQMKIKTALPKEQSNQQSKTVTAYKIKQNKITMELVENFDRDELDKIVIVSNLLFNYIRITELQ